MANFTILSFFKNHLSLPTISLPKLSLERDVVSKRVKQIGVVALGAGVLVGSTLALKSFINFKPSLPASPTFVEHLRNNMERVALRALLFGLGGVIVGMEISERNK